MNRYLALATAAAALAGGLPEAALRWGLLALELWQAGTARGDRGDLLAVTAEAAARTGDVSRAVDLGQQAVE